jgi:hypothetical protein
MAKKDRKKLESELRLAEFKKRNDGKTLTTAQEQEQDKLESAVRSEKFRVAGKRNLDRLIATCANLCKLASSKRYAHTPEQVEKIGKVLSDGFESVRAAFAGKRVTGGVDL